MVGKEINDALPNHVYVFLFVRVNPESEMLTQEEMPTQQEIQGIRNYNISDNARRDGNARRACPTKIEFQEALTVKHPKKNLLVPQSLCSFPDSLLTFTLLLTTMFLALSRSS